ncbi:hypothetical protein QLS71_002010 [Mariniflexile litorale]|uniref:Lipocalin-like domain-containing protein n=1 Tax=Mariniflexile litorale TaxID=3045158 RepID=A0AAU7EF56_9FLAO|nr:hypothetical protein [Mariniflexile sp. KMM 9835]MDQ8210756.1 hypothetical protein [Mariniflexile sp. KMM 9835]
MKKIILALTLVALLLTSCSHDSDHNTINGVWILTEWNVADGFDMNNDDIVNTNILNEIDCVNNETLVFESTGMVSSNKTFNPTIEIALQNGTSNNYIFNIVCDEEGSISYASNYSKNGDVVLINDAIATVKNNKLTRVFIGAIKIYNEDFTEVLASKDLTLVYTKQ